MSRAAARTCLLTSTVLTLATASVASASPYNVPDIDVADSWEINVSGKYESSPGAEMREARVFGITAPLREGLETSVTFGWGRAKEGGVSLAGPLDLEWAVEAEILHQANNGAASLSLEPALLAPAGTGGLSEHAWSVALPIVLSRQIGPLQLSGLISYAHIFGRGADEVGLGILASYALSAVFSVGVEASRSGLSDDFEETEHGYGVGAVWEVSPGYELQLRLGYSREEGGNEDEAHLALERAF
jgi:hypothetical protein